ncbi:hypothetical protein IGI04_015183 [Brassica rapa subsp. trilocularis]|uniref:Glucose-methanol-choline oxidoreductase N-terminal domain-containing protein n=2 Tax=Brassica TaxID=3705 RepID=A0ABQ8DJS6_BRANA|nr:hypothetical protein IGI04_015183 [Brassica rapa subsp. trilocularis]KAH0928731.1 hypothetical protein HID58_014458 [Brassica napus]
MSKLMDSYLLYTVLLLLLGSVSLSNARPQANRYVNSFDSPAQSFVSEEGVPNARGRVLGGSSAINAGFYSRADRQFFENSGLNWDLTSVNPI